MRFWAVLAALALMTGCKAKWTPCVYLEITARDTAGKPVWLRYENARYRVLDTDPLTIEWEHTRCIDIESEAGTVEEVCG
ncbi:MAG: hypothetical protein HKN10_20130, partial [Myxococcales bacterium]|nr:hypothetical protein [Myxococcales bacterium]